MQQSDISGIALRLRKFGSDASRILGQIESSKERTITLNDSYETLGSLSIRQDDLFRQALRCIELGVFRASHVMAWAAFMDCVQQLLESDGFIKLNHLYPTWKVISLEQLREDRTEYALIEAVYGLKVIGKAERKALQGLLSKRNECAHPGDYFPNLNETLGYISELFTRLLSIQKKYPSFCLKN